MPFKRSRHLPIFAYLQCYTHFHRWGVTASSSTVHSHFFLMAKKKFRIFRGWGGLAFFVPLENRAWAVSRSTTQPAESATAADHRRNHGAWRECAAPQEEERSEIRQLFPGALPWTSSRVNGQTGGWLRLPLASTPLRVWGGSGRGRGRG